ncbi:MAG: serine/threonine protein kinase [Phycisphaeraceae bacterium]|nr:MAG: serine/threonine protein kinase [Phycisphaeraceae bacterium]
MTPDDDATTRAHTPEPSPFEALPRADRELLHILLARSIISEAEATAAARAHAKSPDRPLADILVEHNAITPNQRDRALAQRTPESNRTRIPGYRIHETLADTASGQSMLLRATQIALNRQVAIKVLPRKFASNPNAVEQLHAEARKAAALDHPNIVRIYDIDHADDCHYLVMEYIEGVSLKQHLDRHTKLTEQQTLDIAIPIAEALAHAHARNILHLDVKPGNILLAQSPQATPATGIPKLADLGIARAITPDAPSDAGSGGVHTEQPDASAHKSSGGSGGSGGGGPIGTPHYIAPEQIRAESALTPAADIYAFGATLYHMLRGTPPFADHAAADLYHAHLTLPPPPLPDSVETGLAEVVMKCLAKDPADRYASMDDLLTELRAWHAVSTMRSAEQSRQS